MRMRDLVAKEILNNLLNLRFSLAYFLCTFLLIGSASIMVADYVTDKKAYDLDANFHRGDIDGVSTASGFLQIAKTVNRKPAPTRIFAMGGERDADKRAVVSMNELPFFVGDFMRNPLASLFPTVDMIFVIGLVLSLIIFVLTHDAVSGEREEGTLKLLLSCAVPRDKVFLSKWLGGVITLGLPVVTAWLVIMLLILFAPQAGTTPAEWVRMIAILAVCLLYVGVIFSLSMMVSIMSKNSSSAILTLLVVWTLWIVAVPAVATPLSYRLNGTHGISGYEAGLMRRFIAEQRVFMAKFQDLWMEFQKKPGWNGQITPEMQVKIDATLRGVWTSIGDKVALEVQTLLNAEGTIEQVSRWISRLSPYGCLQNAGVTLAGTGMQGEAALRTAAVDYYREVIAYSNRLGEQGEPYSQASAPVFRSPVIRLDSAAVDAMVDVAILLLMGGSFVLLGYLRFLRMEVV